MIWTQLAGSIFHYSLPRCTFWLNALTKIALVCICKTLTRFTLTVNTYLLSYPADWLEATFEISCKLLIIGTKLTLTILE